MYTANNPVNAVDLDGKQPNGLESYFKYAFQDVNTAKIENELEQTLKEIPQNSIDGVITATDYVSDASTVSVIGGFGLVAGGTLLSSTGVGSAVGVPMITAGSTIINYGSSIGLISDLVNLGAKATNLNYDGKMEDVTNQTYKVGLSILLNSTATKIQGNFVKTNSAGRFYNPLNGRFVKNSYGNLLKAGSEASAVSTGVSIQYYIEERDK